MLPAVAGSANAPQSAGCLRRVARHLRGLDPQGTRRESHAPSRSRGRVLGACASELTNGSQPLTTWFGTAATLLTERLAEQDSTEVRLNTMWNALHDRVGRGRSARREPLVRGADTLIHASRGSVSITDLASQLAASERTMERVFREEIGLSPKLACRIARFRHAIDILHRAPGTGLATVAHHTGYFDQPHFTREFRAFAGVTPREWRAEQAPVGSVQSREGSTE